MRSFFFIVALIAMFLINPGTGEGCEINWRFYQELIGNFTIQKLSIIGTLKGNEYFLKNMLRKAMKMEVYTEAVLMKIVYEDTMTKRYVGGLVLDNSWEIISKVS